MLTQMLLHFPLKYAWQLFAYLCNSNYASEIDLLYGKIYIVYD